MKKCPQCNRTYSDESFSFCLADGALLSASYDPDATLILPTAIKSNSLETAGVPEPKISRRVSEGKKPCRVPALSTDGAIIHSTPTRHSRPDSRKQIISFQRRWLQKKYPELVSMKDVVYKLQWLEGDAWVFD